MENFSGVNRPVILRRWARVCCVMSGTPWAVAALPISNLVGQLRAKFFRRCSLYAGYEAMSMHRHSSLVVQNTHTCAASNTPKAKTADCHLGLKTAVIVCRGLDEQYCVGTLGTACRARAARLSNSRSGLGRTQQSTTANSWACLTVLRM